MKLFTLTLLFVCIASGQTKVDSLKYFHFSDRTSEIVYSIDPNGVSHFNRQVIDKIIVENDSLRQACAKLQFLYDKTLGMARKYRREIDSLINVSKTTTSPSQTKPKTLKPIQEK